MSDDKRLVVPFLKWAGGKRWLVSNYSHMLPTAFSLYLEPFLGGGSVFFHLLPKKALIGDYNNDLVHCYCSVKNNWQEVWRHLKRFAREHSDEFYYEIRGRRFRSESKEAARFIYLNRTCFNGIYRENLRGQFIVPRGTKNSVVFEDDDFESISTVLSSAQIIYSDFSGIIRRARRGDFVFIDPPYTVRHNANGFVKYNQRIFSWEDQVRLRDEVRSASDRGVFCLVTNANHQSILDLYAGIGEIFILSRNSVISGLASSRGYHTEIAITVGYKVREIGVPAAAISSSPRAGPGVVSPGPSNM